MAYGALSFAVGDEVIARRTDRTITTDKGDFIRNGTTGIVLATFEDRVVVDFKDTGQIELPAQWVANDHLNLAYALTSYAVQGATQPVSTSVLATGAQQAQLVVNITRGRTDNHLAVIRRDDSDMSHWHEHDSPDIAAAVAASVRADDSIPAIVADPTIKDRLDPSCSLAALEDARRRRFVTVNEHAVFSKRRLARLAVHANRKPDDILGAVATPPRFAWATHLYRQAARAVAEYRDKFSPHRVNDKQGPYDHLLAWIHRRGEACGVGASTRKAS